VTSRLFADGTPLDGRSDRVEDYAIAQLELEGGAVVRLACSWNLPAGRDAVIEASFFGTRGGAALRNVEGSFYDFTAERFHGTRCERLAGPPDAWGGRALVSWARQLADGRGFDPEAERLMDVAAALDAIYAPHAGEAALCAYS
jgi:predicted dehydrogenase